MPIYCYSNNDETFQFSVDAETIDEAVSEARNACPGKMVYVGVRESVHPEKWFDAEDIECRLAERAYEEVGDVAEGWPCFSQDDTELLTARLQALLRDFLRETGNEPTFYAVTDVRSFQA